MSKVEAIQYGDRKVYAVAPFNHGVAEWLQRLPTVWVEGEVTELRRQRALAVGLLHAEGSRATARASACTMARGRFDALRLDLTDGERVHVFGRPELFEQRGDFRLRALSIERFGLGDHLAALERLKKKLAAEGVFERKRAAARTATPDRARHRQRRRGEEGRPRHDHRALSGGAHRSSPRRTSRGRSPRTR